MFAVFFILADLVAYFLDIFFQQIKNYCACFLAGKGNI